MKRMKLFKRGICALLIVMTVAGAITLPASAAGSVAYGAGTVSAALLNIRSGPGMDQTILTTIGENAVAVILEVTNDEWFHINYNGTVGYAKSEFFKDVLTAENFSARGVVTGDDVLLRVKPSTNDKIITSFKAGADLAIIGINNGWYKVKHNGGTGYIRSDFIEITGGYSASDRSLDPANSTGSALADYALQFVGYRYVYGGSSPSGFDCSGMTYYVYKQFGVTLTRNASGQWRDNGTRVAKSDILPGDLLFFSSNGGASVTHVGIYIGDGEFVHASGAKVGVVVSSLDSTYYTNVWYGAKRISL